MIFFKNIEKLGKAKKMISFKDFAKMELKVAEIVSVEEVEGKDKLYKLEIDLGEEKRTILAGIKEWYSAEDLKGKQIIVVANLEPKTLAGIESNGMLLAADVQDTAVLLMPDKKVPNGTIVR